MRGLISEEQPGTLGVASALRQAIPAVYQEDPLFMLLCAAFDDLMAPLVTAVDCFDAYLDPYLAPADFLPWLAALVGYQGQVRQGTSDERARIAGAVRDHTRRGTALGVREAAARAAAVPLEQVELDDPGGTRWSTVAGAASGDWLRGAGAVPASGKGAGADPGANLGAGANANADASAGATVRVSALVPSSAQRDPQKVLAAVRAAIEEAAGVHCGIAVELVAAAAGEAAAPPSRSRPSGARTYGGESEP
jgi:phage tail-like protein